MTTLLYNPEEKVLEIWRLPKKITLYFLPGSTEYLKSWGSNIHLEMEDGEFTDSEAADRVAELWDWLHQ